MNSRERMSTEQRVVCPPPNQFKLKVNPGTLLIEMAAFFTFCIIFFGVYIVKLYAPFISTVQMGLAALTVIIILCFFLRQKLMIDRCLFLLVADALYLLIITLQNEQPLYNYLAMLVPILLTCFTVLMARDIDDLTRVLRVWCVCMFIVVAIDFATMLLWPGGMYKTRYLANWFLGYKTHRLEYSFTLLVLYTCYSLIVHRRLKPSMFWLSALVLADTARSGAAGATAVVALYVVVLFLIRSGLEKKNPGGLNRVILFLLRHYRVILILYLLFAFSIVVLNNSALMNAIASVFNKSSTFSGRVKIWLASVGMASENLLFGNGVLSGSQYSEVLNFNNPHNMMLTYLITGGICGTGILLLFIERIFGMIKDNQGLNFISVYIYCVFLLGIVSSTLSFSPFFFAILVLVPVLKRVDPGYICNVDQ